MVDAPSGAQPTLTDLLEWVGRRWWILLLAVVIGTGGGWALGQAQPETYTSTTLVQVLAVGAAPDQSRLNLDTEAQVVTSVDTAARAQELMGADGSPLALAEAVTVTVPPNTTLLEIVFEAATPGRAQEGAHAFAEAYLRQRQEAAQAEIDDRIARLAEQVESLREQEADQEVIVPLLTEQLLLQTEAVRAGEIRSPAHLPTGSSSPNLLLFTASGTVAGLLLGLALALVVHRLDTRVIRVGDLPGSIADQVLLELRGGRPAAEVVGPGTPAGRQFSRLRNVMRASADAPTNAGAAAGVLLVCGVTGGSAAGFVTANLAAGFARAGERVVVIGGDRDSAVFEALGVDTGSGRGLSEVVAGQLTAVEAAVRSPLVNRVSVLGPGAGREPAELPVAEMLGVVLRVANGSDRVIVEAPPMSRSTDAQALGVVASALLLVVESRQTRAAEVNAAVRDFQQVRAPFAGLLLVPPVGRPTRRRGPLPVARIVPSFVEPPAETPPPRAPVSPGDDDTVVIGRARIAPTDPAGGTATGEVGHSLVGDPPTS